MDDQRKEMQKAYRLKGDEEFRYICDRLNLDEEEWPFDWDPGDWFLFPFGEDADALHFGSVLSDSEFKSKFKILGTLLNGFVAVALQSGDSSSDDDVVYDAPTDGALVVGGTNE